MSLGLHDAKPLKPFRAPKGELPLTMLTTEASLPGFSVVSNLGPVEGIAEISMPSMAVSHLELHAGGKLQELVSVARRNLAAMAGDLGADGVLGLRYVVSGRDYEKSVLAFGTAVLCKKQDS